MTPDELRDRIAAAPAERQPQIEAVMGLHWFDVTLDTPMRQIGWTWVALILALFLVARLLYLLWRDR